VVFDQTLDLVELVAAIAPAALKAHRIQPELCGVVVALDVNVESGVTENPGSPIGRSLVNR
jgi:hypothetical protein